MSKEYVYTLGDILVEQYSFEKILDLNIVKEVNKHSELFISGIVSDEYEYSDKYVECADKNSSITVSVKDDNGQIKHLFYGIITNISISCINNMKVLEIEALSNTYKMDIERKSRSFQGDSVTYKSIFDSINSSYSNLTMIYYISESDCINTLVVQYNETDWQLLIRLASHFNLAIIPECTLDGIKYSIGRGDGGPLYSLDEFNYSITKGLQEYREKAAQGNYELYEADLLGYEFTTNVILGLYSTVNFKDRYLYVYRCETSIVGGVISNRYILRNEKGMKVKRINNENIVGTSLEGKIVDTKNDVVKIALKIDGYSNTANNNTVWIPYSTVFSSPDGTGWYCMPEIGDAIRLYFPDNHEENGYAISSVNLKSSNSQKRCDPSVKCIENKAGKGFIMSDGSVKINSGGNYITLKDGEGIVINSATAVNIKGQSINLSGKEITIKGDESINLTQKEASITIKKDIVMSGEKINTQ